MSRKKDEYRRRIAILKRLRVILLAVAAVLAVGIAAAVLKGNHSKPPVEENSQTIPPTTLSQVTSDSTEPSEPDRSDETTKPEDHNGTGEPQDPENNQVGDTEGSDNEAPDIPSPEAEETVSATTVPVQENPSGIPGHKKDDHTRYSDNAIDIRQQSQEITLKTQLRSLSPFVKLLALLLVLDLAAVAAVSFLIHQLEQELKQLRQQHSSARDMAADSQMVPEGRVRVGTLHNIGARPYQEDSLGTSTLSDGVLAVVADGMGGLSGGDKVSQCIVRSMLQQASMLRPGQFDGALEQMLANVNQEVNQMLGPDGLYKSGSTFLAVLLRNDRFHWITVGDSRIYLYRCGHLTQLNQEHNRGQELILRAAAGEMSFTDARSAAKKSSVTSFIGMGKLKYVEKSIRSIPLAPGDRVLLMSDGVFNTLTDQGIASVLADHPDAQAAADELERLVTQFGSKKQDNFSAVILSF